MRRWTWFVVVLGCLLSSQGWGAESFTVREPGLKSYVLTNTARLTTQSATPAWLTVTPSNRPDEIFEFGSRLVLQLADPKALPALLDGASLTLARTLAPNLFILQTPDAASALRAAQRLSALPGVQICHPVRRRPASPSQNYAPKPNDSYFDQQWYLENRGPDGTSLGVDLNVRAAWAVTRGEGVLVAMADTGVDLNHPELASAFQGPPHYNFFDSTALGGPSDNLASATALGNHGTAVAGLLGARQNNRRGISGVAPAISMASWVVVGYKFDLSDEGLMDMYQYRLDQVSVQNHSWGSTIASQRAQTVLEKIGVSNAVTRGRSGLGIVMLRAGGNDKGSIHDAADEEEVSSPDVIAVSAVRRDGRVTGYSNRGAPLLVAAPSGDQDEGFTNIISTDRLGIFGYNSIVSTNDFADYALGTNGFSGTSAATPQISGIAALVLSANPRLALRDVQQILLLSARHFDRADPDLVRNGAGLEVSHQVGFGVPDAGEAVRLALQWSNRPPFRLVQKSITAPKPIPERALLEINGRAVPATLVTPSAMASFGPEPVNPTSWLPLVDAGLAQTNLTADLRGQAALILRGENFFYDKINRAARLGAGFAIIRNNRDATQLVVMGSTENTLIPAVFIGQEDGRELNALLADPANPVQARLNYNADSAAAVFEFPITEQLICEHVGVRVVTDHPRRADLRITLISPGGTRSILQRKNLDLSAGPEDWTYYSTHHFCESSVGAWKVCLIDQETGLTGSAYEVDLLLRGVPITDSDGDGLDDTWEMAYFHTLQYGPRDDPDGDGYSNAREQLMGTNPAINERSLKLDLSPWIPSILRLSWPSVAGQSYQVQSSSSFTTGFKVLTNLPGQFPQTEIFLPSRTARDFLRLLSPPGTP